MPTCTTERLSSQKRAYLIEIGDAEIGNLATAISIGGLEIITKLILYFFHERAWRRFWYGIARKIEGPRARI